MNYGKAPKTLMLILLICIVPSCKEDPPVDNTCWDGQLPCATQEGKNTFGCFIDGEAFVAKTNSINTFKVNAFYDSQTNYVTIEGRRDTNADQLEKVIFSFYADNGVGTYQMSASTTQKVGYVNYSTGTEYFHDTTNLGNISLTAFNTETKFVSGTFNTTLKNVNYSTDSIIVITNGRFDILY